MIVQVQSSLVIVNVMGPRKKVHYNEFSLYRELDIKEPDLL